ncbi:hypothetical protein BDR07DRAFT_1382022 [Suillus spraguei]|nr:hypothetical protein BDR07DRAFT_1382022 [Suillus spraguei]
MSSEHTVPCRTRPTNANKHPGEIVLQARGHRCTTEEMAAAKDAKAAKVVANQAGIERMAGIELEMEENQVKMLTRKAQPRPAPKGRPKDHRKVVSGKEKSLSLVVDDEAQGELTSNVALEDNNSLDDGSGKRKKKKGIRESISQA